VKTEARHPEVICPCATNLAKVTFIENKTDILHVIYWTQLN